MIGPLSQNLRRLRLHRGLTIGALAEKAGIAKATLSNLEQGRGNPTLETLFALAQGLGFPVGDLIADTETMNATLVRHEDAPVMSGDAVDLRFFARYAGAGESVTEIYDFTVRVGARQSSHGHPGIEHICVKRGNLITGPDSNPVRLRPGDYLSFAAQCDHSYEAEGSDVEAVLVMQYPTAVPPEVQRHLV